MGEKSFISYVPKSKTSVNPIPRILPRQGRTTDKLRLRGAPPISGLVGERTEPQGMKILGKMRFIN